MRVYVRCAVVCGVCVRCVYLVCALFCLVCLRVWLLVVLFVGVLDVVAADCLYVCLCIWLIGWSTEWLFACVVECMLE